MKNQLLLLVVLCISCFAGISQKLSYTMPIGQTDVEFLTFSPDNKVLAVACSDNYIRLYTADSTAMINEIKAQDAQVNCVSFSRDSKLMISGGADNVIKVWDSVYNNKASLYGHSGRINTVAVDPRKRFLFSGSTDGSIKIWNLEKKEEKAKTINTGTNVNSLVLSPSGADIYVAGSGTVIKMLNMKGEVKKQLEGHADEVNAIAISANNKVLVSGSSDKTGIIWDLTTGKVSKKLTGHTWKVVSVALSPDGKYAVTGSIDGTARLWNTETGDSICTYDCTGLFISSVAISPDMKRVAVGGYKRNYTDDTDVNYVRVFHSGIPLPQPRQIAPGAGKPKPGEQPVKAEPKKKPAAAPATAAP